MFPIKSFCVALLLLTCSALPAQNEEHRVRNVVLVHGAWADGSGWKGVYDILVNKMDRAFLSLTATGER
jgi:hypothetical protein